MSTGWSPSMMTLFWSVYYISEALLFRKNIFALARFGERSGIDLLFALNLEAEHRPIRETARIPSWYVITDFEGLKRNSSLKKFHFKSFQYTLFFSSCNNQPWKSDRRTTNSIKQMANPSLCYSQHHPLSGGISERVVTQESHPSSGQAS